MSEKIFVGNVKTVETKFGSITKLGFKESDLDVLKQHLSNGWVNVAIMTSQKTGNPYMVVDTYKAKQPEVVEEVVIPEDEPFIVEGEEELF